MHLYLFNLLAQFITLVSYWLNSLVVIPRVLEGDTATYISRVVDAYRCIIKELTACIKKRSKSFVLLKSFDTSHKDKRMNFQASVKAK